MTTNVIKTEALALPRSVKRTHTPKAKTQENYLRMEEIRGRLKMSSGEFSLALGYVTEGGYQASTRREAASLLQLLAAEGVERRQGGGQGGGPIVYTLLAVHPDRKIEAIPIGGNPQTATIMGREYLLIPKKEPAR